MCHTGSKSAQTEEKELEEKGVQCENANSPNDISVQTDNFPGKDFQMEGKFEKYPCYYCQINIANKHHLLDHIRKCRGTSHMFVEAGLPKPHFGLIPGFPPPVPNFPHFGFNSQFGFF